MTWHRVVCTPSVPERSDVVVAAMFAAGAEGVHEDGATLVTHLPATAYVAGFIAALRAADAAVAVTTAPLEDVDWSLAWRSRIGAHRLGALTVAPPWLADGLPVATTVIIEPAMASAPVNIRPRVASSGCSRRRSVPATPSPTSGPAAPCWRSPR